MGITDPFAFFDPTPYQTVPQLPLQTLAVLSKALSARMPNEAPIYVVDADKAMRTTTAEAETAMVVRLRETNEAGLLSDLGFANAVDGLWSLGRDRLVLWSRYEKAGLDFVLVDPELAVPFEAVREKAARASRLATRLFGDGRLEFLTKAFPEQAQLTANILNLIEADELAADFDELVGEELLPLLRRCQLEYERMVDRRQDTRSRADLRLVRGVLRRRIQRYCTMVLAMLDDSDPSSLAVVETALLPMISLRPDRVTATGVSEDEDEDTLEELVAESPEPLAGA